MRRSIRRFALPLSATLALACSGPKVRLDFSGQNLLLITIDTLRADRLGSYGHSHAQTPHLDRLAREGVRFRHCYSSVPLTLPSHASMFTGRYPFATKVRLNGVHYLDESENTLAELFRSHGYRTSATVSSYVLTSKFGLDQGFDDYEDSLEAGDLFRFYSEIRADEVYRRFSRQLRESATRRFFSWVHFYDPHLPYEPPASPGERRSPDPYDGEIAFVDAQIGRMLEGLEAHGLLESTLIVVTSDHGEAFREHVEEGHGMLCYDETLRVPLIFFAPGRLPGGRVVDARVGLIDLMPTLLELFHLEAPAGLHGRSLAGLIQGRGGIPPPRLYFESLAGELEKNWAPRTGLIAGNYKFIKVPEPELYDLDLDPGEVDNLLPRQRGIGQRLDRELLLILRGEADGGGERQLSPEDIRHLEALGYLSSTTTRSESLIDPKRGIRVEMTVRSIQEEIDAGNLDRAEQMLAVLIADNPDLDSTDRYHLRYQIESLRGNEADAVAALEAGLERFPDSALEFKLAAYHFELGHLDEAELRGRALLEKRPKFSQALNLIGLIAEQRGDLAEALEFFERAQQLEPRSVPLQLKIAETLARIGELERAARVYDALLATGVLDNAADSIYRAATLNLMLGRLERAEGLFRQGLELQPAGRHYIGLALVQARAGDTRAAVSSLETALHRYRDELAPEELRLAESSLRQWRSMQ